MSGRYGGGKEEENQNKNWSSKWELGVGVLKKGGLAAKSLQWQEIKNVLCY